MPPVNEGLFSLWATHGTRGALGAAPAVRRWVLPGSRRFDVMTVAPASRAFTRRMVHLTPERRAPYLAEAELAARRSLDALGPTGVPGEVHTRWGVPAQEIARQADELQVDLVVVGAGSGGTLQRAVLGSTAESTLTTTTRSVFVAREAEWDGPVVLLYSTHPWFGSALALFHALRVPEDIPVCLVALLEPVKAFGGMFLSFSEEMRERSQIGHDAHKEILESHLAAVAGSLSESEGRRVETMIQDCEPRDTAKAVGKLEPQLVVVGDAVHGDPLSSNRRRASQLSANLPCSVVVAR